MPIEKIREGLYVKKGFDGYRVVYPHKNDDGTYNWKNIICCGSYWNLIKVGLLVALIVFGVWAYKRDIQTCLEFMGQIRADPVGFCLNITSRTNVPSIHDKLIIPTNFSIS